MMLDSIDHTGSDGISLFQVLRSLKLMTCSRKKVECFGLVVANEVSFQLLESDALLHAVTNRVTWLPPGSEFVEVCM